MKYKNYYKILGLSGPGATDEEVKRAYRKLAKKYHPDNNKGDYRAEEIFKDVNEAYQMLGDSKKRKRYNIRYRLHFIENGISIKYSPDAIKKFMNSEFVKIFIGEIVDNASKESEQNETKQKDDELSIDLTLEEAFQGVIKQIDLKFPHEEPRAIKVRVPRGANSESKVLLREEGQKDLFSGVRSDLIIKIHILPNSKYSLEGNNLIKEIKIAPSEAVLGSERSITSIDGVYKLKIPEGVQNGEKLTIKDAGYINKDGKRGDFLVSVKIDIPKELTAEEKELYAKLRKIRST